MRTVVLYHGKCYDGFTAAWVAKQFLTGSFELIPATYGEKVPDLTGVENLFILDFSYPRDVMVELSKKVKFMKVLDHHKTAQANCEGLEFCEFDMERSGAGMAWDYFSKGQPRPALVNYVEDRDLWRFALPYTAEVHAYYSSFPMELGVWDDISSRMEAFAVQPGFSVYEAGSSILRYDDQKVEEIILEARHLVVAGHTVPVVNCPIQFGSKVGHRLLELDPGAEFSAYYMDAADGTQRWGLRGRDKCSDCNGTGVLTNTNGILADDPCHACEGTGKDQFDVSEIAKQFGGGGHKKAAGFVKPGGSGREILART